MTQGKKALKERTHLKIMGRWAPNTKVEEIKKKQKKKEQTTRRQRFRPKKNRDFLNPQGKKRAK